ncbi:MAG: tetratricopeptide repeat protein [Verrucomicrobia bacterium]|nr:tetratricopeptide repeat protein [Verrucomicrobiota bacterium]
MSIYWSGNQHVGQESRLPSNGIFSQAGHQRYNSIFKRRLCGLMLSMALSVATAISALAADAKIDLEALTKKAESGDRQAQYDLGIVYYSGKDEIPRNMELGAEWFLKSAQQGHTEAQFATGRCYFYGRGVPRDKVLGVEWYHQAALKDHKQATYALGDCYFVGEGVERDHAKSLEWFSKSAAQGEQGAQFRIARILEKGDPSVRDPLQALAEYKKSANGGNAHAEYLVGTYYEEGKGVPQDIARAIQSYKIAAPKSEDARLRLARLYGQGKGVEADPVEAYKWLETAKSSASGDLVLSKLKAELEATLTPEQRQAAAAKIEAYIKQHNIQQDDL